jgi:hypothetical protein
MVRVPQSHCKSCIWAAVLAHALCFTGHAITTTTTKHHALLRESAMPAVTSFVHAGKMMPVIFVIWTANLPNSASCRSCRTKGSDAGDLVWDGIPEKADNHDA